jgi:hypothetical protein
MYLVLDARADDWKVIGPRALPVVDVRRGSEMKTLLVVTIDGIFFY